MKKIERFWYSDITMMLAKAITMDYIHKEYGFAGFSHYYAKKIDAHRRIQPAKILYDGNPVYLEKLLEWQYNIEEYEES